MRQQRKLHNFYQPDIQIKAGLPALFVCQKTIEKHYIQ